MGVETPLQPHCPKLDFVLWVFIFVVGAYALGVSVVTFVKQYNIEKVKVGSKE